MTDIERRPELVDLRLPTIALVGRVNVGKSTLFNRIVEKRQAVVSDIPGTTRTRNIGIFTWRGAQARIIDAGGLTFHNDQPFEKEILEQTKMALHEADIVFFVIDVREGVFVQEREIAKFLRKQKLPVMLIANKTDAPRDQVLVHNGEFLQLGFGAPHAVSSLNGVGVGDVLDQAFKVFNKGALRPKQIKIKPDIKVAILGKPNVGKSTLLNQIAGTDMVITSPEAHTTRETFDMLVKWNDKYVSFLDTAGIRKKAKVDDGLERIGVSQSIYNMQSADVVMLVIDATDPVSVQEKVLARLIDEKRRSLIVLVNKWDLIADKSEENRLKFIDALNAYYPHIAHAEILFVSAKSGYKIHQLFELITACYEARHKEIDVHTLDTFMRQLISKHKPQRGIGSAPPKIYALKQLATDPPEFQISVKARTSLNSGYIKFVERALREQFGFVGTPIKMYTKKIKQ